MASSACKRNLPQLLLTELTERSDSASTKITFPDGEFYFCRPKFVNGHSAQLEGSATCTPTMFHIYPLVFCGDGTPWDEANLFIFKGIETATDPEMSTFAGVASDLASFRRFLEAVPFGTAPIDWLHFPPHKHSKPTFRYRGHLLAKVKAGELKPSTANRQIGVIVRFYRWLLAEKLIALANPPWKEWSKYISVPGDYGEKKVLEVRATDLRIPIVQQDDPFDGMLEDGGKLRPLPPEEQEWVIEALETLGNTEMMLIHLFALLTGARIQTILTFKVRHVLHVLDGGGYYIQAVGPGTGIGTKNSKKLQIHIPIWFMNSLRTYAVSARAVSRRRKAVGGDTPEQYLFLSVQGTPMYLSKEDVAYPAARAMRHKIAGQAVRQYMRDSIWPLIRAKYDPKFVYHFHDLRASFGMNMVDHFAPMLERGEMKYTAVLNFVRTRLGHESMTTTEGYLSYRNKQKIVRKVQDDWESRLQRLVERGMRST